MVLREQVKELFNRKYGNASQASAQASTGVTRVDLAPPARQASTGRSGC